MCASSTVRGRRVWLWLTLGLGGALAASGCATKKDLKLLRDEMLALQAHQDSLFQETQRQNRLLLDTLRASLSVQMDAQGQTSHRFQQLEQQLERTEAILQQMQLSMANFTDRLDRQAATNPTAAANNGAGGTETAATAGEADEAWNAAMEKMSQGAYSSARYTFEFFLERFPADPRAVDAQYQIAETYAQEADIERAITELTSLEEKYSSNQEKSAAALVRAGILAEERLNNKARAREFYQTVTRRYPNTEAYREAQRRLNNRN